VKYRYYRRICIAPFTLYTAKISKALQADADKHNKQYPPIIIERVSGIHDRFLIIDDNVYHIGASIKDLGKKLFAFSKMRGDAKELLDNLNKKRDVAS
jgi:hypothetical protein